MRVITFAIILSFFIGNVPIEVNDTVVSSQSDYSPKTITYKTNKNGEDLTLDIYEPLNRKYNKSPVLLYIHGGSWISGDKSVILNGDRKLILDDVINNGYTVISVQYSLLNENVTLEDAITDCKDAMRWIHGNTSEYNLDENNIGVWGTSAGAHLAMMSAYSNYDMYIGDNKLSDYTSNADYVIDYYGPTELDTLLTYSYESGDDEKKQEILELLEYMSGNKVTTENYIKILDELNIYSPVNLVSKKTPSTLIVHGDKDKTVPISQSQLLDKTFEEVKNKENIKFYTIAGGKHAFLTEDSNLSEEKKKFIVDLTLDYIYDQYNK